MRVAYLDAADLGRPRMRDSLDILVPNASANLFATCRSGHEHDRTTLVRAPLVSVLPPALPHSLTDRLGSNTLILSIAGSFFAATARATLDCDELTLIEPHASPDALIREVGDAVELEFRSRDRLRASYLESLAAVLAAHVARTYVATKSVRAASAAQDSGLRHTLASHRCCSSGKPAGR